MSRSSNRLHRGTVCALGEPTNMPVWSLCENWGTFQSSLRLWTSQVSDVAGTFQSDDCPIVTMVKEPHDRGRTSKDGDCIGVVKDVYN